MSKNYYIILLIPIFLLIGIHDACGIDIQYDPAIAALIAQVDTLHLRQSVFRLQNFNTRYFKALNRYNVADSIRQWFIANGVADVNLLSFGTHYPDSLGDSTQVNVITTIPGTEDTTDYFVIGGHYDSYSSAEGSYNCYTLAPGADDNGCGVAAVFEMARLLSSNPLRKTVKCIAFAAEEGDLLGSTNAASTSHANRDKVICMVNFDVIAQSETTIDSCGNHKHQGHEAFSTIPHQIAALYGINMVLIDGNLFGSDHGIYNYYSYPAMYMQEIRGIRHHTIHDSLAYLNFSYASKIVKTQLAAIAHLDKYPPMVFFPEARDNMDGVSLTVTWSASGDPRLAGYRVCYGLHSGVYTDTSEVTDSTTVIGGLMADSTYYFTVYGYYGDGTMSISAREVTGIPRLNPVKPTGLAADPLWHGLRLAWRQNPDPDLAGYRLYRRLNQDPLYDSLNTAWLTDTAFTDSALSAPNRYYYRIRAFDDDGNCSVFSDSAYGRPATLDQGILVVDETQNWTTGSWPRDTTQDQFYDSILVGYRHQDYEFGSAVLRPVLSDLVPYSTVLWHSDDPGQLLASNDSLELRKYLDFGGKLWLVGWKATSNLRGYISYPGNFEAGDFIYDYLKVSAVNLSGTDDSLQGVMGTLGYPGLAVDPAKVPLPLWGGTLRYVESYTPSAEGEVIYNIDMRNNSSSFEGLPCGIRYLGAGYKTVLFGFPLYFMNRDQARLAAQQVMADFGETGVAEGPSCELKVPSLELFQNVPNPFSRTTIIRYQLPKAGQVSLKVYNVAGQLVRTLVEDTQGPGLHSVTWHSDSDHGSKLASGIYFVQLLTGNDSRMSKVILLR